MTPWETHVHNFVLQPEGWKNARVCSQCAAINMAGTSGNDYTSIRIRNIFLPSTEKDQKTIPPEGQ